jgi:hypothetical protein
VDNALHRTKRTKDSTRTNRMNRMYEGSDQSRVSARAGDGRPGNVPVDGSTRYGDADVQRFVPSPREFVVMAMVFVVHVAMGMFQWLVGVVVLVPLAHM